MNERRPYQYEKTNINSIINFQNDVYVTLDNGSWKRPKIITLEKIGEILKINVNDNILERNVSCIKFSDQEDIPDMMPNRNYIVEKTFISVDENYLYVWIPSLKKWKRTLLCDWI